MSRAELKAKHGKDYKSFYRTRKLVKKSVKVIKFVLIIEAINVILFMIYAINS
jgi:hypothetical protein